MLSVGGSIDKSESTLEHKDLKIGTSDEGKPPPLASTITSFVVEGIVFERNGDNE